jgi:phosphatidylglycerophosphatase GEP4
MSRQFINSDALKSLFDAISNRSTRLRPAMRASSVAALNPQVIRDELKTRAVVFDVDNTLTLPYANQAHSAEVRSALRRFEGVFGVDRIALLSNHAGSIEDRDFRRAAALERELGCRVLRRSTAEQKPNIALGSAILSHFANSHDSLRYDEIALVGDRVLTDVYFANRLGMRAVLVDPLDVSAESWVVRLARRFENSIVQQ